MDTGGNIMPVADQLVEAGPHALHSLDPQGGIDMAVMKKRYGRQVCLIGNVNCGLLDTGSDEQVAARTSPREPGTRNEKPKAPNPERRRVLLPSLRTWRPRFACLRPKGRLRNS